MVKKLVRIGSSWGFIIPKETIDFLEINPEKDKFQFIINENGIDIRKIKKLQE